MDWILESCVEVGGNLEFRCLAIYLPLNEMNLASADLPFGNKDILEPQTQSLR